MSRIAIAAFFLVLIFVAGMAGPQSGGSGPKTDVPWYQEFAFPLLLFGLLTPILIWSCWDDLVLKIRAIRRGLPRPKGIDQAFEAPTLSAGPPSSGNVNLTIDAVATPGTMVSGKATFSDGKTAGWYLDEFGRLGLRASEPGYQPPPQDVPVFQGQLQALLAKQGY